MTPTFFCKFVKIFLQFVQILMQIYKDLCKNCKNIMQKCENCGRYVAGSGTITCLEFHRHRLRERIKN